MTDDHRPDDPRPYPQDDGTTQPGPGGPAPHSDWPFAAGAGGADETSPTSALPPAPRTPAEEPSPWSPAWHQTGPGWSPAAPPPPPPYGYSSYGPAAGAPQPRRRRIAAATVALLVVALVGGGVGAAVENHFGGGTKTVVSSLAAPPVSNNAANKAPAGSVQQVAAGVLPSVVSITVATSSGGDEGSGIILSSDGQILTNNHVVAAAAAANSGSGALGSQNSGPATLTVTFNNGKTVPATIVGRDPTTDLAVIKAKDVQGLHPASLGKSTGLAVGQPVVAIGSPLGLSGTVTSGIVSALDRPVQTSDSSQQSPSSGSPQATVIDAIQTDAAINPGNSGGALVNMQGQVVGINSAIASLGGSDASGSQQSGSIGVGFAIPIDEARPIVDQLVNSGTASHAQLGVSVSDASSNGATPTGAKLASVSGSGAAAKAGLQQGDVVTKLGDREIDSADALVAAVRANRPGDAVTVTYERGGATHTATVTLGSDKGH
ncbi:MAG TPA: trypsin-like peptidase domain-containing protein [Mycobacteriales bacterium]